MKLKFFSVFFLSVFQFTAFTQVKNTYIIPAVSNPVIRMENLQQQWKALHQSPPRLGVRDCFLFLLDALDTKFLKPEEVLWTIDLVKTRIIADSTKPSFGNMFWGWTETGGDVGDGMLGATESISTLGSTITSEGSDTSGGDGGGGGITSS